MGEIFSTDERVQEAKLLFEEACAVVQAIDKTLTHQILLNNLLWQVIRAPNIRPLMWKCVEAGYDTNIDLDNGWIIKYGKGMTPTHDKYAKIVKKKASESARTIAANKEESAKAKARLRVAKELAAKRLEEKEKRLELLDAEHMVRRGFKRFVFGETLEVPLSPPDKTYFKPESPIEAPSIWGELKAPRKKIATKEDESNLSAQVEGNGNDSVEKASESSVE
ncbi:hypothetical protein DID88_000777 [Monilinia fructigena]|uniref:Ketopantoate reductase C-terminal domain-containing protein n=1 Tax=Monilinia fructigena TaxID=38457 RepID=A0A395IIH0_9HELO|nr:hypothetical protein DID88_000777 [Monilinia fructigena]